MHVVIILAAVLTATSASAATCEFGDAEQCPKLCEAGDVESCYFHARMLGSGNQVPQDAARAQQMFIAACRKAHPDACNAVAHSKLDEGATFLDVQPWFEMGCAFGSSKACNNMGSFLRRESYGRQKESLGFFVRSCTLGAMHATTGCVEAGNTLRDGKWGTAADSKRAAELYAWGCALGDERQCAMATALGLPSSSPSPAERLRQHERDCAKGALRSCYKVGIASITGKGTARDRARAEKLLSLVCGGDVDVAYGCAALGRARLDGALGPVDAAGAVAPLKKACESDRPEGAFACEQLAELTVMGQGVPVDRARAQSLYETACRLTPPRGCEAAGALRALDANAGSSEIAATLFARGCTRGSRESCLALGMGDGQATEVVSAARAQDERQDVEDCRDGAPLSCLRAAVAEAQAGDTVAAGQHFEIGCRGGEPVACIRFGALQERGDGGAKDLDAAFENFARACSLGHAHTCKLTKQRRAAAAAKGVSPEAVARATKILGDACSNGIEAACLH